MKFLCTALFCLFTFVLQAQDITYSRVKIYTDDAGMNQLALAGITIDHGVYKASYSFTTDLSSEEIERVRDLGFNYVVEIPDVQAYYRERNTSTERNENPTVQVDPCDNSTPLLTPANFTLGSMGGFFTVAEIYWHMDNLATLFPTLVKPRLAIDTTTPTFEGRNIYWMKVSDNPLVDENEPEMLYTAAHHAREPAGVSQLIMYMYYLCENYNSNPEIQYIVNNTELYFIPLVNPDGYFYNETTDPSGGGMWRKNRLDHMNGSYGVDLNRNYSYNWGYDNFGSSPNDFDDTYRGASAASEPEVQNVQTLCSQHNFEIAVNYHTYGNLLIYPFGYALATYTPDSTQYFRWGNIMTSVNHYSFGTADQTVHYSVNGSSDDWMYGDQVMKPKIMAMTPEAGDQMDGFWPMQNRIEDICKLNIPMDLYAAKLLLAFGITSDAHGKYIAGPNGYIKYDFERLGLDSPAVFTVGITPLSPEFTNIGPAQQFGVLPYGQIRYDSIAYSVNPATPNGTLLTYVVETNNGSFTWRDTITKMYGVPTIIYSTAGNNMSGWTAASGWAITSEDYVSASTSITDSPNASYNPQDYTYTDLITPLDLTIAYSAHITFWTKFDIEAGYDYAQVSASVDGGASWTPLCGKYTMSNNSLDNGNPVYTGRRAQWVKEDMSLDAYVGSSVLIRFSLQSDWGSEADGLYFDDFIAEILDTTGSTIDEHSHPSFIGQNIPNPTGDETFIPLRNTEAGVIEIYSQVGQLVMTLNVAANANGVFVSTAGLTEGVYTYRFVSGNVATTSRRMVITR
jgi:carboxypeptidase T